MGEHRFRDQLTHIAAITPLHTLCGTSAFVACPMFAALASGQQTQIQEIYRVAAERTREQLRPKPSRIPQFSLN